MLDSLLGSIVDLIYDLGTESVAIYLIPTTSGRLDDFNS